MQISKNAALTAEYTSNTTVSFALAVKNVSGTLQGIQSQVIMNHIPIQLKL
jgi:hypothetical protein